MFLLLLSPLILLPLANSAAFNMKLGVIILRMQDGLDCSDLLAGAQDLPTLDPSSEGPQQTPDVDDDATPPPFTLGKQYGSLFVTRVVHISKSIGSHR